MNRNEAYELKRLIESTVGADCGPFFCQRMTYDDPIRIQKEYFGKKEGFHYIKPWTVRGVIGRQVHTFRSLTSFTMYWADYSKFSAHNHGKALQAAIRKTHGKTNGRRD